MLSRGYREGAQLLRLDLFLRVSRLVKRRTVAKEACVNGRILLNSRPAKPAAEVKPGDTITLDYGPRLLTVEVLAVPTGPLSKAAAADLYRILEDRRL